jgi:hypothetical protein
VTKELKKMSKNVKKCHKMSRISLYPDVWETKRSDTITIYDFYEMVTSGHSRALVEAVRAESDKKRRAFLKKKLPVVTVSGTFSERKNYALLEHSKRIAVDIDPEGNPHITDMPALRDSLGTWAEIEFAALSASGRGVFCTVLISNPDEHRAHFFSLERTFKKFNIVIDPSCKNVARARYMSYDPDAVFNVDVTPFVKMYHPLQPTKVTEYTGPPSMDWIPKWLEGKGYSFIPGSRHTYIVQFAGAAHRTEVPEHEVRSELLRYASEDFPVEEIESIITNMYSKTHWK